MPRTIASWLCLVVLVGGCETARRTGAMDDGRALPDLAAAAAASHEDLARASETARDGATHSEEVAPCTAGVLATGEIPWGIAVHGDRVYWIERGHNLNPGGGKVMAVDKSGANLDVLATGDPGWAIDVDDDQVYWNIAQWEGAVMKRSLAGGAPVEIAMEGNSAFDLAVDPTGLYWGQSLMGRLIKAPHGGTPIVLDPGTEGGSLRALTLDSTHVYYTTDDQILRVPKSGGTVTPLYSTTLPRLWGIAVDETSIYFSTFGDPGDPGSHFLLVVADGGTILDGVVHARRPDMADE